MKTETDKDHLRFLKEHFKETSDEVNKVLFAYALQYPDRVQEYHVDTKKPAQIFRSDTKLLQSLQEIASRHNAPVDSAYMKKFGFDRICKIFNPAEAVDHFDVENEKKFKHVADPKLVHERLEGELARYINVYRKHATVEFEKNEPTAAEMAEFVQKRESHIADCKASCQHLLDNFDDYEVRIISKRRANTAFNIFFHQNGEREKHHLYTERPNIIFVNFEIVCQDETASKSSESLLSSIRFNPKVFDNHQVPDDIRKILDISFKNTLSVLSRFERDRGGQKIFYPCHDRSEGAVLYLVDDLLIRDLEQLQKSHHEQLPLKLQKQFAFDTVCRMINPNECVSNFSIQSTGNPCVHNIFFRQNKKKMKRRLFMDRPNILLYQPGPQSSMIVDSFMENAVISFGDVYACKK
jgi:hypothetical protein